MRVGMYASRVCTHVVSFPDWSCCLVFCGACPLTPLCDLTNAAASRASSALENVQNLALCLLS